MPESSPREELLRLAAANRITLHESRAAVQSDRTFVIWTAGGTGMAICPAGQPPEDTVQQLREEIKLREDDARRAAAFQARVSEGAR
ncbi:hypothetical protein ACF06T_28950 [Streptomyces albidoflavus]